MPKKKKTKKKVLQQDFTINDCANALKPVTREKKIVSVEPVITESWDTIDDDDFDIIEEVNEDGTKNYICKKRENKCKQDCILDSENGVTYPEIVWYLISRFIKPEDVGRFAGINRTTYGITKYESFWRGLYRDYCDSHKKLPPKLRIENSFTVYGLRQRVIRSLYHTYDIFVKWTKNGVRNCTPHDLIKRKCTNIWYDKEPLWWTICFKFKEMNVQKFESKLNFIEELGRIDANPEENSKVLQVRCLTCCDVPPLMGMTLSSVKIVLSQELKHYRVQFGFNSGHHNVSKSILPECLVILDTVVTMTVMDWWHPKYPHYDNRLPTNTKDDESIPVLRKDFFESTDCEL